MNELAGNKKSPKIGLCASLEIIQLLNRADIACLFAFGAGGYIKCNLLVFGQSFEPTASNGGEVGEKILTAISGGDEAEAFSFVKPFNSTVCHRVGPFFKNK